MFGSLYLYFDFLFFLNQPKKKVVKNVKQWEWRESAMIRMAMAMLGKVRSDWSSPGLVTLQEVCPLSSAITSDFWAAHGLSLECPSPRLVSSTSYRVQSTRPVAPGWEYTWPLGHVDLLHPSRWLRLAAHPPSGAVWTPPPYEVQPASWGGLPGCGTWSQHVRDLGDGWKPGLPVHPTR